VHSCVYCLRQVDLLLRRLVQIRILSECGTGPNNQVPCDDGSILLVDSYGRAGECIFIVYLELGHKETY